MTLTFNELRRIKDQLPSGSIRKIAEKLSISEQAVRNCFGASNFEKGSVIGVHYEQGPDGGLVTFDDPTIVNIALELIEVQKNEKVG
jgi:predicted transcriptional regulator